MDWNGGMDHGMDLGTADGTIFYLLSYLSTCSVCCTSVYHAHTVFFRLLLI